MALAMSKMMRPFSAVALVIAVGLAWAPMAAAGNNAGNVAPLSERESDLMGIAASCVAFYQAAMTELDLPLDANEPKRQAFLDVFAALGERGYSHKQYEAAFQRDVVMRTIEVTTIIENDPDAARPRVLANLPKCDSHLDEMKRAAALD